MMKKTFALHRVRENKVGTWGTLSLEYPIYQPFAVTYEKPWIDNTVNASCIPADTYLLFLRDSNKRGLVYEFVDVPCRKNVQMHIGNFSKDTKGCVLVGEKFEYVNGRPAILESRKAMREFLKLSDKDMEINLNIIDCTRIR